MYANGLPILSQFVLLLLFASEAILGQDQNGYQLTAPKPDRPQVQLLGNRVVGIGNVTKLENRKNNIDIVASDRNIRTTEFHFDQSAPRRSTASVKFRLAKYWKHYQNKTGNLGPYELDLTQLSGIDFSGDSRRFLIVIHGYLSLWKTGWREQIREKWLELDGDAGGIAIGVTWGRTWTYDRAVADTVLVARQVTILLHYLALLSGTHIKDPDFLARIHFVGHSLGAHMAGFIGKDLEGKLGRITALDPAGPIFDKLPSHQRLHRTDARLVEVLHTNSGRMSYIHAAASAALGMVPFTRTLKEKMTERYTGEGDAAWFGIDAQLGHVEYYANNGRIQPGCKGLLHICDHKRATRIYVDLLTHACSLRHSDSAQANRLRAFRSPDYESFAAGHSFLQHCPQLMNIETHLNHTAVRQAFDQCSVPLLDVTKPLEEVIDELKTKYGIDFDDDSGNSDEVDGDDIDRLQDNGQLEPSAALRRRPSFYFKTTPSEGDLVGDHFLLKIYLTKPTSWNEASCSLDAQIIMPDGDEISLQLKRLMYPADGQTILAMPFVYHSSAMAKYHFNDLLREAKMDESSRAGKYIASSEFSRVFRELFPEKISLKLAYPMASSIFSTVYNLAKQIVKPDDEVLSVCQLTTDMIEVHPLVHGLEKNFGALYGRDLLLSGDKLQVISTNEQMKRRRNPSRRGTTLSADGVDYLTSGLDSAVVG